MECKKYIMRQYRAVPMDKPKDSGEFVYGWYFEDKNRTFLLPSNFCYYDANEIDGMVFPWVAGIIEVRPDTVGQAMGEKDKNKVEIYEDDIVKICNPKCQIQLFEAIGRVAERHSSWGVTDLKITKFKKYSPKVNPPDVLDMMYFLNIIDNKSIEIISNIHENPELLTNNQK